MNMQVRVEALKQKLEQLFPGKWLNANKAAGTISTGIDAIDTGITRGVTRKRISQWSGPLSSGKTTLLRNAVRHWCAQGLNVAYIDSQGNLLPADWSSIGKPDTEAENIVELPGTSASIAKQGKFWIVRPQQNLENTASNTVVPLISRKTLLAQDAIWGADQFIRSNAFDVVILDLGREELGTRKGTGIAYCSLASKIYARLQRALDKSKAALIIVSDQEVSDSAGAGGQKLPAPANWGCHTRFTFNQGIAIQSESGLKGITMIVPTIKLCAWRDGLSQELEVKLAYSIPNRLFTHPQVSDRRTSKG